MVFVKGVKCPSLHTQFLDYLGYRALQFYIVLRVNAFLAYALKILTVYYIGVKFGTHLSVFFPGLMLMLIHPAAGFSIKLY